MTTKEDFRKELVQILDVVAAARMPRDNCFKIIDTEGKTLSFPNQIGSSYWRAIRILRLKSSNSGKLISDHELETQLDRFLIGLKYASDQTKVKPEIDKHIVALFDILKKMKSTKYLFLIPVMNLRLATNIEIADSLLVTLNAQFLSSLESKYSIKFGIDRGPSQALEELTKENETQTFAIVVAEAPDNKRALELAFLKAETCLNVLRLYYSDASFVVRDEFKKSINRELVHFDLDERTYGESLSAVNLVANIPTTIDQNAIDKIRAGLEVINDLLGKRGDELTPLQKDLLTALLWFGTAVKEDQRTMKFLQSITALEALLIPDGGTGKQEIIAKRFASIAYAPGSDSEKREAYLDMRNLYEIRNSIIHSGEGYVYEDDLAKVMYWVQATIQIILHHARKFATLKDLMSKQFPVNEALYERPHSTSGFLNKLTRILSRRLASIRMRKGFIIKE